MYCFMLSHAHMGPDLFKNKPKPKPILDYLPLPNIPKMHELVSEHYPSDIINITISHTYPQCITKKMFDTDTYKTDVNSECALIKVTPE